MTILKTILPLVLKLIPVIAAAWAARDFSIVQAKGGFETINEILAVLLPVLIGGGSAAGAFYVDAREKRIALETEPPVAPTADEDAVQVNAGGVKLSLRVERKASADPAFRATVVEMVKSSLAVRGGGAK